MDQNSLDSLYQVHTQNQPCLLFVFSSMMIVAPCFDRSDAHPLNVLLSRSLLVSVLAKRLPLYGYTSFVSSLVLAKFEAVSKSLRKLDFAQLLTGCILHGHVAIITKPSPPFPVCDVVLIQGLLLIFLHSCEMKSGSGLGTRLSTCGIFCLTHSKYLIN